MSPIDQYLTRVTPPQRVELERVRNIVKQAAPSAVETISYGMPTFTYKGKRLIHFAAYKNHMSIFGGVRAVEGRDDVTISHKGTLQFTENDPIPEGAIVEIVHNRLAEIDNS